MTERIQPGCEPSADPRIGSLQWTFFVLATFPSTASDGFSWNGATVSNRDSPEHQVVACVREAVAGSFQNAFALS